MVSLNVSLNFTPFTVKLQTYIHFDRFSVNYKIVLRQYFIYWSEY